MDNNDNNDNNTNQNMKDCVQHKYNWFQCSSQTFIKYYDYDYDNNFNDSYYKEMNVCLKFYKKYHDCMEKIKPT